MARRAQILIALLFCACVTPAASGPREAAVTLPPFELPKRDVLRRQHVEFQAEEHSGSFDAVVQKRGDSVLMLGLTPFGTKAFELTWLDGRIRFRKDVPLELPFSPEYIFDDVARTYFVRLPGGPFEEGTHVGAVGDDMVTEVWHGRRLISRRFTRASGVPTGELSIAYGDGMSGDESPPRIELDNGWFHYRLTITTVSEQTL